MANSRTYTARSEQGLTLADFAQLIKLNLTLLVVFTSVMAYLISAQFNFSYSAVIFLALGGLLVTGASNALNQVLEKDYDKLMTRTANRPVASGRMSTSFAVMAAGMMSLFGITILALFNPLTAFLGMLSLMTYAFVYTPLKRYSSVAVLVGAVPGAMPMMIGCVAFDGYISTLALLLFAIQFLWQFPHFWAISKLSFDDYKKAGYLFIPSKGGEIDSRVMTESVIYASLLIPISIAIFYVLNMSFISLILLILAAVMYLHKSVLYFKAKDMHSAKQLMFASLIYLPVMLSVLIIDQII